jgi:hypothetical protein
MYPATNVMCCVTGRISSAACSTAGPAMRWVISGTCAEWAGDNKHNYYYYYYYYYYRYYYYYYYYYY